MIALACAAAFGVPQAGMAADGELKTGGHPLTLKGNISIGFGFISGSGATIGPTGDYERRGDVWTGESNVRFSSSSKLGGTFFQGVGFQVESGFQTDEGGSSSTTGTLASRNTGVGVKTSIGTIWGGKWDTPYKEVMGEYYLTSSTMGVQASTSGFFGSQGLTGGTGGTANGGGAISNRMNFRRRQVNTINYYSPEMSNFQFMAQYSPGEEIDQGSPPVPDLNPYLLSMALAYYGDKLTASIAWERHNDFLSIGTLPVGAFGLGSLAAGAGTQSRDTAWSAGVRYEFGNSAVSLYYERLKWTQSGPAAVLTDLDSNKWSLSFRHNFGGPHQIRGAYGKASDYGCNTSTVCQNDTGVTVYNFIYRYRLDKVTWVNVAWNRYDNDRNGNYVPSGGVTGTVTINTTGLQHTGYSIGVATSF